MHADPIMPTQVPGLSDAEWGILGGFDGCLRNTGV